MSGKKSSDDLDESLTTTRLLADAIQQFASQKEEFDNRLKQESGEHAVTKAQLQAALDEFDFLQQGSDNERREAEATRLELDEVERFNCKSQEALKALADDLVSVRLENEALRAEMETQRKAFVVNVNWAARHADLKTKLDELQLDYDKVEGSCLQMNEELEAADREKAEYESARTKNLEAPVDEVFESPEESKEFQDQIAAMEELKAQLERDKELLAKQKQGTRDRMRQFLQGNEATLLQRSFQEWAVAAKASKHTKEKKDQSFKLACRRMANSDTGTLDFCLTAWHKHIEEIKVQALVTANRVLEQTQYEAGSGSLRGRQKALAKLERTWGNEEKGLQREAFGGWAGVRAERLRQEKAKAVAFRAVAGSTQAFLIQAMQGWAKVLAESQAKREKKASGQARAMRMIASSDNAILDFCLTQWHKLAKQAVATKKAKDSANVKAARLINNSAKGMQQQIVVLWAGLVSQKKGKAAKMKAVQRNLLSSAEQLVTLIFGNWKSWQEAEHKEKSKKIMNMNAAQRAIQSNSEMLVKSVFTQWNRQFYMEKTDRLKENLGNVKGVVDEEAFLMSQEELAKAKGELEAVKVQVADVLKRLSVAESVLGEREETLQGLEQSYVGTKKELEESRRKAKDINDELARVGNFLSTWPRKTSAGGGGRQGAAAGLPKIGAGGSSRPMSGRRTTPPQPGARTAWE